jgi:choline monooxygenase
MTCPYHGWTYDLTGALTKVPRLTGTERFDLSKNGLREIAVQVYGPFVWCAFLPSSFREGDVLEKTSPSSVDSAPPVAEWLGDGAAFLKRCGSIPANGPGGNLRFVTKRTYRVNCNWKVFVDNYLDGGYHVPVAHPALAAGVDMRTYETRVEGNTVTQTVAAAVAGKEANEAEATKKTSAAKNHRNQNRRLGGDASATYAYVYPNFMVNRYGPWMDTNLVTPTSATTCTVTFEYFLEPAFVNDAAFVEESLAASHVVQMEDIELCEKVQRGMRSPGYEPGRYVALEKGMYHFHRKVWEDLTDDAE